MKQTRFKGRLIVIEGADGAGTTTQVMALAKHLQKRFIKEGGFRQAVCSHEPYSNDLGRHINMILSNMDGDKTYPQSLYDELALSFATNRLQHFNNFIAPHLNAGNIVICDRYTLSSFVYQGLNCNADWIRQINSKALVPDLLIYLQCSAQTCSERIKSRGLGKNYYESDTFYEKIAERYNAEFNIFAQENHALLVNGEQPAQEILNTYLSSVEQLLN